MTTSQCKKFLQAVEEAGIKSYEFDCDTGSRFINDEDTYLTKVSYDDEAVVAFHRSSYMGSVSQYEANVEVHVADFADIHEIRTAGSAEQIEKFAESFGVNLDPEELKIIFKIDRNNLKVIPEADYEKSYFHYLSELEYQMLPKEKQEEYDKAKEEFEDKKKKAIGPNQAARITY